eukprot:Skav231444  [mRNA]  locus=scaffold1847:309251:317554:- [translate_table: standard]
MMPGLGTASSAAQIAPGFAATIKGRPGRWEWQVLSLPSRAMEAMAKSKSEGAPDFVKNSKVGSATGFMMVAGSMLAIPHKTGTKMKIQTAPRFSGVSEYQECYKEIPHCYASMDRKPLIPYHPNATRSRLAAEDAPVPLKNASTIAFQDTVSDG